MKRQALVVAGLLVLVAIVPAFGEVAYTRYKYGCYSTPWCCYSILAQDYDCQGNRIIQWNSLSCYDTGSGNYWTGTCGGGCIQVACGGQPTKICVIDQPNIGCGNCDVFLEPLPGYRPANCTSQLDPACRDCMIWPSGMSCYTVPYDASADLDSGFLCDRRTAEMIASGCNPPDLSCPTPGSFIPDVPSINLSSGEKAGFTGAVSAPGGGTASWKITVEQYRGGKVWQAVDSFEGSGASVSWGWDGKDLRGKEADAGDYRVSLAGRTTGGTCGGESDFKIVPLSVQATRPANDP